MEVANIDEQLLEEEEYYNSLLDDICTDDILEEKTTASLNNTRNLDVTIAPPTKKKDGAPLVSAPPRTMAGEGSKGKRQQGGHSNQEVPDHPKCSEDGHFGDKFHGLALYL